LQGIQAAKGVFKKKPEHDLTGATELLKIKDLDKQAVVPYSDAQSRLTHTRVPEKPKVVTSAGKKSSKVRGRRFLPHASVCVLCGHCEPKRRTALCHLLFAQCNARLRALVLTIFLCADQQSRFLSCSSGVTLCVGFAAECGSRRIVQSVYQSQRQFVLL
jgi:hypothetical protein